MKKTFEYKNEFLRTGLSKVASVAGFLLLAAALTVKGEVPAGELKSDDTAPSATVGCPNFRAPVDFDGDGKTDIAIVRNTGGGVGGAITWFVSFSNGGSLATPFGRSGDSFVPADYDGDGKADIAVWRSGTEAYFYILQSQTNTFRADPFGQTGDDPTIVGDYTGDGKADPAVYRAGANAGNPSFWYYRPSSGAFAGQVLGTQWGQNGDFPSPGDYDGDGRNDFVVQRNNGSGQAIFYFNQTSAGFTSVVYGTSSDSVVPGDYDGDCKTDVAVARSSGGVWNWFIRNSTNGATQSFRLGAPASDFLSPGDYDGDRRTDIAMWRSGAANVNGFYWRGSLDGAVNFRQWGQVADYPPANFNVH